MCTVLLPPGDNPIAVNKYIYIYIYIYILFPFFLRSFIPSFFYVLLPFFILYPFSFCSNPPPPPPQNTFTFTASVSLRPYIDSKYNVEELKLFLPSDLKTSHGVCGGWVGGWGGARRSSIVSSNKAPIA